MRTLYKFIRPEHILKCLPSAGDGTLRATQPLALNDPFECAVTDTYGGRGGAAERNRECADVLTRVDESRPISADCVHLARRKYGSLFMRQLFAQQVSHRFGIVSFTDDYRHPLMWSHYTLDGSGFVVGYDRNKLLDLPGWELNMRRVDYTDRTPRIQELNALGVVEAPLLEILSRKSKYWEYEQEWRLIIELRYTIGSDQLDQHGLPIQLVRIPNEAVVDVYYTERTPQEMVKAVQNHLADKNNRYTANSPRKLFMSRTNYEYVKRRGSGCS